VNYRGTIAYRTNTGAHVPEGFLFSVVQAWNFLMFSEKRARVHFMRGQSCMVDESANQVAEQFLGDWVLMLDTDHVFAADAFYEMITTFEGNNGANLPLDVLVGFTQKRFPPYHPVLYKTDAFNAMKDFETIFPNPVERQTLIPIDSSGAACLMVRRTVFDEIKKCGERPFDRRKKFNAVELDRALTLTGRYLNDMPMPLPAGRWQDETFAEDSSFFWRAQMLGFKAWCAPWIKFHHLSTILVDESMIHPVFKSPIPE
jgi:cellulose synthase/poly-beta-1,6-N-acetylglucosamine synthase-like glycosyltransferase